MITGSADLGRCCRLALGGAPRWANGVGVALVALALAALPAQADSPSPMEFTVLSYNLHGLPAWIAGDDPAARMPAVGRLARGYDLAFFQEDFIDAYHNGLAAELAGQGALVRGNGPRGALRRWFPVFAGSGLATFADSRVEILDVTRQAFGSCSGWISKANDCFASKGFLRLRARVDGEALDVYNVHLDAGRSASDRAVRERQLALLERRMEQLSGSEATLVAGDFNLDFDEPHDRQMLERFRDKVHLEDSGARRRAATWSEELDYILLRSGPRLRLVALEAGEAEQFVGKAGRPLSDHPAVFARVRAEPLPEP